VHQHDFYAKKFKQCKEHINTHQKQSTISCKKCYSFFNYFTKEFDLQLDLTLHKRNVSPMCLESSILCKVQRYLL